LQHETNFTPQNVKSPVNTPFENGLLQHDTQVFMENDTEPGRHGEGGKTDARNDIYSVPKLQRAIADPIDAVDL